MENPSSPSGGPGTLYLCATPIGNLEDASIRLLKTLQSVDLIACEDTRHTLKLLNHFQIKKRLISYHEHSSLQRENQLLSWLQDGKNIALVSDAGMPVISDPGNHLIIRATNLHLPIDIIPGPSACTAALVLSGFPGNSFIFMGFVPEKSSTRKEFFSSFQEESRTVICYESPHRLQSSLKDLCDVLGKNRTVAVVKEITKKFQQVKKDTAEAIYAYFEKEEPRGEFCILIAGYNPVPVNKPLEEIFKETEALIRSGVNKKEAIREKSKTYGIRKSDLYRCFFSETQSASSSGD